jgi:cell division protein ZapA
MEERRVNFFLFGQEFSFYSDAPDEEVEGAIALLREELEGTELAARSTIPSSTMLVLGCLQLAARCVRLEGEFARYRASQEKALARIIDRLASEQEENSGKGLS